MAVPEICVIFNPAAGKHRGRRRLGQIRKTWGDRAKFRPTLHPGHATELASQAAGEGFHIVVAAGGDGTAHEVLNGLMRAGKPDVQFAILPIGSANDYAYSLGLHEKNPPPVRRVDVGLARRPDGSLVYFGCCLGVGFSGQVTREARRIRRLQGVFLYGLATLRALAEHYETPSITVNIDEEPAQSTATLMFTALVGKREGGFVLAPNAEVDDGWLDFVHVGALSRWEVVKFLPRLAMFGPPANHAQVRQGRCRRVRLHSEKPLIAHADGELFCLPEHGVQDLEIELLPGALRVVPFPDEAPG
ncbi:MAG: diacylglycerol kinase family lipid kinase [Planctomycetes bacterium]|nr:diacylglycerol kinase family lipid kinase [Planctomycetota bacterium]